MDDWSPQFKSLMDSALGQEIVITLRDRAQLLTDDAQRADTQESAFGLLKEARGVIKALEHLQSRSVVLKNEGGKVK